MVVLLHVHYLRGGYIGVDLFFVLSGFLITSILLREAQSTGRFNARHFYGQRARRLLPALCVCLLLTSAMAIYDHAIEKAWWSIILVAAYLSNYISTDFEYLGHTWSLAVEAQFYALWPIIIIFLARRPKMHNLIVLSLVMVTVLLWRLVLLHNGGAAAIDRTYRGLDTRCDTLIAGSIVAFALNYGIRLENRAFVAFSIMIFAGLAFAVRPGHVWMQGIGFSVTAVSAAYIVGYIACCQKKLLAKMLCLSPITYLGKISYGLYLYHFPILHFLEKDTQLSPLLGVLLSLLAASLSWHFIEKPIIDRTKKRREALSISSDGQRLAQPEL